MAAFQRKKGATIKPEAKREVIAEKIQDTNDYL